MTAMSSWRVPACAFVSLLLLLNSWVAFAAVGNTWGRYAVAPDGAAHYDIDLTFPPGLGGLEPSLSLSYSSRRGNDLAGMGWTVSGLSVIERCGKTLDQDNAVAPVTFTNSDKFCLNGNKLRLTGGTYGSSGSTYQTELETFSKVTANGSGPTWFKVQAKDGLTYEYGNSTDSRILAFNSNPAVTRVWALSKISDRSGNYIRLYYTQVSGSYRPDRIEYTGTATASPTHRILFGYQDRPSADVVSRYLGGYLIEQPKRLTSIKTVYISTGEQLHNYLLTYFTSGGSTPRSRLKTVTECAVTDSECFPATDVAWQSGTAGWHSTPVSSGTNLTSNQTKYAHPIDINGDGRADLVYPQAITNGKWQVMLADESGSYATPIATTISDANYKQALPMDVNGDGKQDVIVPGSGGNWNWLHHTGGTSFDLTALDLENGNSVPATGAAEGDAWTADVSGDGLDDLVWAARGALESDRSSIQVRINKTSGTTVQFANSSTKFWESLGHPGKVDGMEETFMDAPFGAPHIAFRSSSRLADFNGDGRVDLLVYTQTRRVFEPPGPPFNEAWVPVWKVLRSTGTSFVEDLAINYTTERPYLLDANGDGASDLAYYDGPDLKLRFGRAAPGGEGGILGAETQTGVHNNYAAVLIADYDGDGLDDLLGAYPNLTPTAWHYARSTGENLSAGLTTGLDETGYNLSPKVADIDGNGLDDIAFLNSSPWSFFRHKGLFPDLVATVTDGFDNQADFNYSPITDDDIYTPQMNAGVPAVRDYEGSLQVVSALLASNGLGGNFSIHYTYEGAKINTRGRGFLGFNKRTTVDSRNGVRNVETYKQAFPYIGLIDRRYTYQSETSNTKIADLDPLWASLSAGSNWETRKFPYVDTETRRNYEVGGPLDGDEITVTTTERVLDSYGTPTYVTETVTESVGGDVFTTETYIPSPGSNVLNDTTNWCIGRPERLEVKRTTPAGTATRVSATVWDAAECRITTEIVEPDRSAPYKLTTEYEYDSWGNRSVIRVIPSEAGAAERETTVDYTDTDGRFPWKITNPLGQFDRYEWKRTLGVPAQLTDINGLVTNWVSDDFGRLQREERPDGTATDFAYLDCTSGCGGSYDRLQIIRRHQTWPGGVVSGESTTLYDMLGRPRRIATAMLGGALSYSRVARNSLGQITKVAAPWWSGGTIFETSYVYDLRGRVIEEKRPVNDASQTITQSTLYAYEGVTTRQTDPLGEITTTVADGLGRVNRVTDASSGVSTYEYDPFDNLTAADSPASPPIEVDYDILGRKSGSSDPDMGDWTYTYNSFGELVEQVDAKNQHATFEYDPISRMTKRTEGEGITQWTWDTGTGKGKGQIHTITHPESYSETYAYDAVGRTSSVSTVAGGTTFAFNYSYDGWGRLFTVRYPESHPSSFRFKLRYIYDGSSGLLTQVVDDAAPTTVFWQLNATDERGHAIDETFENGLQTTRTFDRVTGWIETVQTDGGTVQDLSYDWDKLGNLTGRHDLRQGKDETFVYDPVYRVTDGYLNGNTNLHLTYGADGNILTKSDGVSTLSYSYTGAQTGCTYTGLPPQPHAVRNVSGTVYCYDNNGNMTKRNGATIDWTSYNMPKRIREGSDYADFRYGPSRSRYKQVNVDGGAQETTYYIGGLYERVTRSTGTVEHKHYVAAGGEPIAIHTRRDDASNDTVYLHKDHLGSVDTVTNGSGSPVVRLSYDAFGKRRGAAWSGSPTSGDLTNVGNTTHRGFTFHEHLDNIGLIHMNGRVFDPNGGRFLSADPFVTEPMSGQGFNRYSYVRNNPLSLVDPSGFADIDPEDLKCTDDCIKNSANPWAGIDFNPLWNSGVAHSPTSYKTGSIDQALTQWGAFSSLLVPGGSLVVTGGAAGGAFTFEGSFNVLDPSTGSSASSASDGPSQSPSVATQPLVEGSTSATGWWNTSTTTTVCGVACAKAWNGDPGSAFAPQDNTGTNGERVLGTAAVIALPLVGLAPAAVDGAAAVGRAGWSRAQRIWRDLKFDGPSPGLWHANGRIFGVRWKNQLGIRLDLHPLGGDPTNTPVLHLNVGPLGKGEAGHIPLFDPRWLSRWRFGG